MIETERLILRPLSPQDKEAFIRGIADDELRRMYGFPAELSEDTARRIFAQFSKQPAFGLVRKTDGALVGFCWTWRRNCRRKCCALCRKAGGHWPMPPSLSTSGRGICERLSQL